MERLSIDFEWPVASLTSNMYILVITDEYLQLPFVFPCPNMHTTTIIKALDELFRLTGIPCYIHSDRGASFMSKELSDYLIQNKFATSKTTPHHPTVKMIQLSVRSQNLIEKYRELIFPEVLHSARSLLCITTNTTPQEFFFSVSRRSLHYISL